MTGRRVLRLVERESRGFPARLVEPPRALEHEYAIHPGQRVAWGKRQSLDAPGIELGKGA